jgi:hypothetical protein
MEGTKIRILFKELDLLEDSFLVYLCQVSKGLLAEKRSKGRCILKELAAVSSQIGDDVVRVRAL